MKVLIVDDSNVAFGNMSILVERLGIEVLGNATTEKEIENSIKRHTPELVLMDTRASYIQGTDTIRKIKKISPDTNIVAVSVFETQQAVKQVFASGISDIITKPVEADRLIESLRKLGLIEDDKNSKRKYEVTVPESSEESVSMDASDEPGPSPEEALAKLNKEISEQDVDQLVNEISNALPQAEAEETDAEADVEDSDAEAFALDEAADAAIEADAIESEAEQLTETEQQVVKAV